MSLLSRPYAYSKMEKEDPEEVKHRKAQFLIYKSLKRADSISRRRQSCLRMRIFRLKIKVGKRLKRLRKRVLFSVSAARTGLCKQFSTQLKPWKKMFSGGRALVSLPPVFN
ncbi:hypothetical protein NMG60_11009807 [Bertholletia excelsa]